MIALTVAAVFAALQAVKGRREAQTQRDRAQEQTRIAISRQLAADSGAATGDGRPDLSLLLAAQARRVKPTPQADDAVLAALQAVPQVVRVTPLPEHGSLATSTDGRMAAVVTQAGRLEVRRVGRSSIVAAWPFPSTPMQLAVTGDGAIAVASSELGAVSIFRRGRKRPARFEGPKGGLSEESGFDGSSIAIAPRTRLVAWNGHRVSVYNGRRRTFLSFPSGIVPGAWNLSFNADGTRLAAASDGTGEVVVWTLTTDGRSIGAPLRFQAGRGTSVLGWGPGVASIAFSPTDPRRLVTSGFDGSVTLRDANTGRSIREIHAASHGIDVAFSADGRRLLTRGDDAGRVWTLGATPHSTRLTLPPDYGAIGFGADGRRVLAAGKTALTEVSPQAPPAQTTRTLNGPTEDIGAIAIDPRGRWLATLDLYGDIDLWDLRTLTPRGREFYAPDAVDLRFSDDGRTLLAWSNAPGRLRMWDVATGAARSRGAGGSSTRGWTGAGRVTAVVLAGTAQGPRGAARRPLERSTDWGPVLLAPDGRTVVGAISKGRAARLWDAATGRVRIARMPWTSLGLAYDPTGRYLAIGDTDLQVSLWDAHSGRRAGVLETPTSSKPSRLTIAGASRPWI